ncbi:unnamed protein product [Camellia sinensis]
MILLEELKEDKSKMSEKKIEMYERSYLQEQKKIDNEKERIQNEKEDANGTTKGGRKNNVYRYEWDPPIASRIYSSPPNGNSPKRNLVISNYVFDLDYW